MSKPSRLKLHFLIHSSSLLHGGTAFATAQIPGGGTVTLTVETISTLVIIASLYNVHWTKTVALTYAKQQFANIAGVKIADGIIKYIPLAGNTVHGLTSLGVTEWICWTLVNDLDRCS